MVKHYHLIGIGGIGMSGIAKLLLREGCVVSGSDLKASRITEELRGLGARVFIGHNAGYVRGSDTVIYSSAIKDDNPEVREAKKNGVALIKRAEALAQLMRGKAVVTVAGSHGKTTTTSLAALLLLEAGLCPTVAVGGILKNIDTNACLGKGDFFVAEADESDGSFLYYRPKYSIITNIDKEHLDYYQDFNRELDAFREFLSRTQSGGCAFCCADDLNLKNMALDYGGRAVLFGLDKSADIYPENIQINGLSSEFDCFYKNKFLGPFRLSLGGRHNISNALAVIALGLELGIALGVIKKALADYQGAGRRLEIKFNARGILVLDDYAHHPTEIKAALAAARNLNSKRIIAVFQPHRYTRTKLLLEEFSACFDGADYLVITDIYAASETPIAGITAESILDKIRSAAPGKEAAYLPKEKIAAYVLNILKPGDLLISLGAGDIVKVCDELVEGLKGQG